MPGAKCINHKPTLYFDWKGQPRLRDAHCPLCLAKLDRTALSLVKRRTLAAQLSKEHPVNCGVVR